MPLTDQNNLLPEAISSKLSHFKRIAQEADTLTAAAVVICILPGTETEPACILLTRRSSKLRNHPGQYALPGGKVDAGENIIDAAVRELEEELNLPQSHSRVLGQLDDIETQSGFNISPVVILSEAASNLRPNPDEVAAVYRIPLVELETITLDISYEDDTPIDPNTRKIIKGNKPENSRSVMSMHIPSVGTSIYSPTAAIIYQFIEVGLRGLETRVAHFGQPRFAWQ